MKSDACPVCKARTTVEWYAENVDIHKLTFNYEFSPDSQKTFRVVRCHACTHVFCAPLLENIYKNYEDVTDEEYLRHQKSRVLSARAVLKAITSNKPSGKLLDVGCATGDFLSEAKNYGYSVEGLELSRWSTEIARRKGIRVYRETLKSLARKFPQQYDIVTLWGVIEHFEAPDVEMKYVNQLLKPGGLLAVWTGDVDGLMSKLLGRRWWYWQGQHIQYFTRASLNYLGKRNGFEHVTTKMYPIAATYEQMENSLSRYKFQKLILPVVRLAFALKPIWYLYLPGELFWTARKT